MSFVWILKNLFGSLLLPPGNGLLLLAIAGVFRQRRWAFGLAVLGGVLLMAQSIPLVSNALMRSLESQAVVLSDAQGAGAIVVLGSSLNFGAPEYGGDTANERTLVRLRYGAALAHQLNLPVLVSGGQAPRGGRSEAAVMAEIMEKELAATVRWREDQSTNTAENARFSAQMLHAAGVQRVVLVTQAFHIPRARLLFERAGLAVVVAPTGFKSRDEATRLLDWLPQASALHNSYYALHEWLGILWITLSGSREIDVGQMREVAPLGGR